MISKFKNNSLMTLFLVFPCLVMLGLIIGPGSAFGGRFGDLEDSVNDENWDETEVRGPKIKPAPAQPSHPPAQNNNAPSMQGRQKSLGRIVIVKGRETKEQENYKVKKGI